MSKSIGLNLSATVTPVMLIIDILTCVFTALLQSVKGATLIGLYHRFLYRMRYIKVPAGQAYNPVPCGDFCVPFNQVVICPFVPVLFIFDNVPIYNTVSGYASQEEKRRCLMHNRKIYIPTTRDYSENIVGMVAGVIAGLIGWVMVWMGQGRAFSDLLVTLQNFI